MRRFRKPLASDGNAVAGDLGRTFPPGEKVPSDLRPVGVAAPEPGPEPGSDDVEANKVDKDWFDCRYGRREKEEEGDAPRLGRIIDGSSERSSGDLTGETSLLPSVCGVVMRASCGPPKWDDGSLDAGMGSSMVCSSSPVVKVRLHGRNSATAVVDQGMGQVVVVTCGSV